MEYLICVLYFIDGLGQLTDGILGDDTYHLKDNNWIGWKKQSNINLNFYFDTYRNLTSIRIHTSNYIPYDIYLFHSIRIQNCKNSNFYYQKEFFIPTDYNNTSSRFIQISFQNKYNLLTNCLNIILNFHNKSQWILISEIEFDSTTINQLNLKDINKDVSWYWIIFVFIFLIILFFFIYIQHKYLIKLFFFFHL